MIPVSNIGRHGGKLRWLWFQSGQISGIGGTVLLTNITLEFPGFLQHMFWEIPLLNGANQILQGTVTSGSMK